MKNLIASITLNKVMNGKRKKILIVVCILITLSYSIHLYDYGKPLDYSITQRAIYFDDQGFVSNIEEIQLPKSWLHLELNPYYVFAIDFHNGVNSVSQILSNMMNFIQAFAVTVAAVISAILIWKKLKEKSEKTIS